MKYCTVDCPYYPCYHCQPSGCLCYFEDMKATDDEEEFEFDFKENVDEE